MAAWYAKHYPGVEYHGVKADSPEKAEKKLRRLV
jgi:hypothetical protein